jgi:DNA-binding MarR family transcriptional regulator/N-acetylglutamate synthase-like GNAT family acetyltransferase
MMAPIMPPLASDDTLTRSIAAVREFNRFYTKQIGVLQNGILHSRFSLTEVRVLYELAHRAETNAAKICEELALDPGYVSRMVRDFIKQGLVRREPSPADGRQSVLTLTNQGKQGFAILDTRQDQDVAAMLKNLSPGAQKKLIEAMSTIAQLFAPGSKPNPVPYMLRLHQPGDIGWVVHRHGVLYAQEYGYDERFEALVAEIAAHFIQNYDAKRERCWIAEREGGIAGCVFLVRQSKTIAKLRMLLVEPIARGVGIGKRLVDECVRFARQAGYKKIVLWTQSELAAARHLYEAAGFQLRDKHQHDSWGRTKLVAETWDLKL